MVLGANNWHVNEQPLIEGRQERKSQLRGPGRQDYVYVRAVDSGTAYGIKFWEITEITIAHHAGKQEIQNLNSISSERF